MVDAQSPLEPLVREKMEEAILSLRREICFLEEQISADRDQIATLLVQIECAKEDLTESVQTADVLRVEKRNFLVEVENLTVKIEKLVNLVQNIVRNSGLFQRVFLRKSNEKYL